MRRSVIYVFLCLLFTSSCTQRKISSQHEEFVDTDSLFDQRLNSIVLPENVKINKELLYDQYTLKDVYPYKDTTRVFQWDKFKPRLAMLENMQRNRRKWGILQNYKNRNGQSALVEKYKINEYNRVADTLGVDRYQSVALFAPGDTLIAQRYGRDGSLVRYIKDSADYVKVASLMFGGEWYTPKKYVKEISDTVIFNKAIFIDVSNQNIATLEYADSTWLVRSMNPATTGRHLPPYAQETPVGIFVIQEKKNPMVFLKDGSLTEVGGYAAFASRFTNGAYIHGVPVNAPRTEPIEYSYSLGTIPRSHMCVRNATSHAKFLYNWSLINQTVVFVID